MHHLLKGTSDLITSMGLKLLKIVRVRREHCGRCQNSARATALRTRALVSLADKSSGMKMVKSLYLGWEQGREQNYRCILMGKILSR